MLKLSAIILLKEKFKITLHQQHNFTLYFESARLLSTIKFEFCSWLLIIVLIAWRFSHTYSVTCERAKRRLGEVEKKNYKPPGVPMQSFFVPWNKAECRAAHTNWDNILLMYILAYIHLHTNTTNSNMHGVIHIIKASTVLLLNRANWWCYMNFYSKRRKIKIRSVYKREFFSFRFCCYCVIVFAMNTRHSFNSWTRKKKSQRRQRRRQNEMHLIIF